MNGDLFLFLTCGTCIFNRAVYRWKRPTSDVFKNAALHRAHIFIAILHFGRCCALFFPHCFANPDFSMWFLRHEYAAGIITSPALSLVNSLHKYLSDACSRSINLNKLKSGGKFITGSGKATDFDSNRNKNVGRLQMLFQSIKCTPSGILATNSGKYIPNFI